MNSNSNDVVVELEKRIAGDVRASAVLSAVVAAVPAPISASALADTLAAVLLRLAASSVDRDEAEAVVRVVAALGDIDAEGIAKIRTWETLAKGTVALVEALIGSSNSTPAGQVMLLKLSVTTLGRACDKAGAKTTWDQGVVRAWNCLLTLIVNENPKVRRAANATVAAILSTPGIAHKKHIANLQSAKFVLHIANAALQGDTVAVQQLLSASKAWIALLSTSSMFEVISTMLRLLSLNSPILSQSCFETTERLFASDECKLSVKNIQETIQALAAYTPSPRHVDQTIAYSRMMLAAHQRLNITSVDSGSRRAAKLFEMLFVNFASDNRRIQNETVDCISKAVVTLISDQMIMDAVQAIRNNAIRISETPLSEVVAVFEDGFNIRFFNAREPVLQAISLLIHRLGDAGKYFLKNIIDILGAMYYDQDTTHKDTVVSTLATAVSALGPESFLQLLPLNFKQLVTGVAPAEDTPDTRVRDWLMPILRDHIQGTNLAYFASFFVPLANALLKRSQELTQQGSDLVEAKTLFLLHTQIWNLIVPFCDFPRDIAQVFPALAEHLGRAIALQPDLRQYVCVALRNLIEKLISTDPENPHYNSIGAVISFRAKMANSSRGGGGGGGGSGGARRASQMVDDDDENGEDGDGDDDAIINSGGGGGGGGVHGEDDEIDGLLGNLHQPPVVVPLPEYAPSVDKARAQLAVIAQSAKNFLHVLFNAYVLPDVTSPDYNVNANHNTLEAKAAVLNCIAAFAKIAEEKLFNEFLRSVLKKVLEASATTASNDVELQIIQRQRRNMLDIALHLAELLDSQSTELLYKVIRPYLVEDSDKSVQKKAYGILLRLCRRGIDRDPRFVQSHFQDIAEIITGNIASVSGSSRRNRLLTMFYLFSSLSFEKGHEVIEKIMPEVIFSTKEINARARATAYNVLVAFANKYYAHGQEGGLHNYLLLIAAGLGASSEAMLSATINALTRVFYEFSEVLPEKTRKDLIDTLLIFFQSKFREVGSSLLGFFKVVVNTSDAVFLTPLLPDLVPGLLKWVNHSKTFKIRVRFILKRLLHIFDFDIISMLVPADYQRLLQHVKKMDERRQRDKANAQEEEGANKQQSGDNKRKGKNGKTFDDFMREDESDTDDEGDHEDGDRQQADTPEQIRSRQKFKIALRSKGGAAVDLLDSKRLGQSIGEDRQGQNASNKAGKGDSASAAAAAAAFVKRADDGRLIFNIEEEHDHLKKKSDGAAGNKKRGRDGASASMSSMDVEGGMDRDDDNDDNENDDDDADSPRKKLKNAAGRGTWKSQSEKNAERNKKLGKTGAPTTKFSGNEYKSKKSKSHGDMKLTGKLDPFAYVPLNKDTLNRRKAAAAHRSNSVLYKKEGDKVNKRKVKWTKSKMIPRAMKVAHKKHRVLAREAAAAAGGGGIKRKTPQQ